MIITGFTKMRSGSTSDISDFSMAIDDFELMNALPKEKIAICKS